MIFDSLNLSSFSKFKIFLRVLIPLIVLGLPVSSGFAATLSVSKTADTSDGTCDADCSLREAITAAIAGDTITFAIAGTITLGGTQLTINKDLTIR